MQEVKTYVSPDGNAQFKSYTKSDISPDKPIVLYAVTKEPYLLARVFYKFRVMKDLIKQLKRCYCVEFITPNLFHINYIGEMESCANLSVKADDVPDDIYPIILAKGIIHTSGDLTIDVSTFERIHSVYNFMKKHVKAAYITTVGMRNQFCYSHPTEDPDCVYADQLSTLDYDRFFSQKACIEALKKEKEEMAKIKCEDNQEHEDEISSVDSFMNTPANLIEFFPMDATRSSKSKLFMKTIGGTALATIYSNSKTIPTRGDLLTQMFGFLKMGEEAESDDGDFEWDDEDDS